MRLIVKQGENFRNYIGIADMTMDDYNHNMKLLEKVVSRTEYKPFSKGLNKNIHESYLINKTWIPAQFFQDIMRNFIPALSYPLQIENLHSIFNNKLNREDFMDFAQTVKLPPGYDVFNDKYEYQLESVFRALLFKTARIEVGTGGGKTLITYEYCRYLVENFLADGKKILIIVPRKTLCTQTRDEFMKFDQYNDTGKPLIVETIYSGSKRFANANIVIGTWQSLKEFDMDYYDDFSVMICDEAHSAKAYSIRVDIYNKCRNVEFVLGMTGTWPDYQTIDYLNVVAMFGPLVFIKKTKELIADGNVCPVLINKVRISYNDEDRTFSKNLKLSGFTGSEKFRIEKKFFQNHTGRTDLMLKLLKLEHNHLILVENVEYVLNLQKIIQERMPEKLVYVIYSKTTINEREEIKRIMTDNHNVITIATYETMSTGVSINNIMHVHFPDGGRSEIRIKQSVGRGLRLHPLKDYLNVFDYQDQMPGSSFLNHSNDRNKIYMDEGHPSKEYNVSLD